MKIHHIGYLVENIYASLEEFERMGAERESDLIYDSERMVDIVFVRMDTMLIELISPREESAEIGTSLRRLRNCPYHICFRCNDINDMIQKLVCCGSILIKEPQVAVAIDNKKVAFLYNDNIGVYEIVEE